MTHRNRIITATQETIAKARQIFVPNLRLDDLEFRNCGKTGGWASMKNGRFIVTLNEQLLSDNLIHHAVNEIIPHELAHIVCYQDRSLGRNHDRGWQRVCRALGGSGSRCHTLPLQRARAAEKFIYIIGGKEIEVGKTRHKRIQTLANKYNCNGVPVLPEHFTGRTTLKT